MIFGRIERGGAIASSRNIGEASGEGHSSKALNLLQADGATWRIGLLI